MVLLESLPKIYKSDPTIISQLEKEFGNYKDLEAEYDEWWHNVLLNQIITQSSNGNGRAAGAGPVDYNEGKILYFFVRREKPRKVLEIGFASGCSGTVIARALEVNGSGILHTVDYKSNPIKDKWIIDEFKKYIKNGLIIPFYPKDGVEFAFENTKEDYQMIFSDASHELDFCDALAWTLNAYYPDALHLYHEWSFSPLSSNEAKSYLAIPGNLRFQAFAERECFEKHFPSKDYEHYGFYGSCGLGVVKKL